VNRTPSQSSELKFEIGHVLFIDIVGYSKLLNNEQSEQLQTLKEVVRGTEQVRLADGVCGLTSRLLLRYNVVQWLNPKYIAGDFPRR
jgi:hypothetical protein